MSNHHATIYVDGVPVVSHLPQRGCTLSPLWMPHEVAPAVAEYAGLDPWCCGAGYDPQDMRTVQVEPNVYELRVPITVTSGRRIPGGVSYVDAPTVEALWVGTSDYR